jgi:sugar phosphate isomerase/epimerase
MKLSISNIAWEDANNNKVYDLMKKYGYEGIEIAPTRIFPNSPYKCLKEAQNWAHNMESTYDFKIPSMQSIWFGKSEKLFGSVEEREALISYTKEAIDFAEIIGCGNLVFGCPRNRAVPDIADKSILEHGIIFFRNIGEYAITRNTVIGMEANPPIYNTNYINTTSEAFELIENVESKGFLLNLDIGTMVYNSERTEILNGKVNLINHVHVSEPGLAPIAMNTERRNLHNEIAECLSEGGYQGYVSVEMGKTGDIALIEEILDYVREIFG